MICWNAYWKLKWWCCKDQWIGSNISHKVYRLIVTCDSLVAGQLWFISVGLKRSFDKELGGLAVCQCAIGDLWSTTGYWHLSAHTCACSYAHGLLAEFYFQVSLWSLYTLRVCPTSTICKTIGHANCLTGSVLGSRQKISFVIKAKNVDDIE